MKKYVFSIIMIIYTLSLFCNTLNVGPGQEYSTIQAAVNVALDQDIILLHPFTYTENVVLDNFLNGTLLIKSLDPQDSNIVGNTIVRPLSYFEPTFIRTASQQNTSVNIEISGLSINEGYTALRIYDIFDTIHFNISYCYFENNE